MGNHFHYLALAVFFIFTFSNPGVCRDNPEISALRARAVQGDTRAMCDLARAYYHGRGVLKDPLKARCWVERAHRAGAPKAKVLWERWALWQYSGDCGAPAIGSNGGVAGERLWDPETGMVFVWVPGGCFKMGCVGGDRACRDDEFPVHRACLDGFWMGETEVTQAQWQALTGGNPSRFRAGNTLPVEQVSFGDIQDLIRLINSSSRYDVALPTEAQWEYAARSAGQALPYPWGEETYRPRANCGTCDALAFRGRTAPVKAFPPNDLGLYGMGGNVGEWCRDVYDERAYDHHKKHNPTVRKQGRERVIRGGSWADNAQELRCSKRGGMFPQSRSDRVGFRLVLKKGA